MSDLIQTCDEHSVDNYSPCPVCEIERLGDELDGAETALTAQRAVAKRLTAGLEHANKGFEEYERKYYLLKDENERLSADYKECYAELIETDLKSQGFEVRIATLQAENESLTRQVGIFERSWLDASAKYKGLSTENEELREDYDLLQARNLLLEDVAKAAREAIYQQEWDTRDDLTNTQKRAIAALESSDE